MKPSLETADVEKYSPLAPMAVVTLLLGMSSILALIGPFFFLIPLAAVGVGLIALGKIGRSDGALSGQTLAHAGIALAIIFLAAAVVRGGVRDRLLKEQAGEFAIDWTALMTAGKTEEAGNLLSGEAIGALVPKRSAGSEPQPAAEVERQGRERFKQDPLVQDYASADKVEIYLDGVTEPVFDAGKTIVTVTLSVGDPTSGSHRHVQLQLVRAKYYEEKGDPWRVDRWEAGGAHGAH